MNKFFDIDSVFMQLLTKAANIMLLNILWFVCCLPIITAGASTGAMYTVALQLVRDEDDKIITPFFRAFRASFWKPTALLATSVVVGGLFMMNTYISQRINAALGIVVLVPFVVYLLASNYLFPLYAQFENTMFQTMKNAVFLSILNPVRSILAAICGWFPFLLLLSSETLFWNTVVIWPTFGAALIAYLQIWILGVVFNRYIKKDAECSDQPETS